MKNAIIGTFICILTFLSGCYLGFVISEEQTIELDGVSLTRFELQKMFTEFEKQQEMKRNQKKEDIKKKKINRSTRRIKNVSCFV